MSDHVRVDVTGHVQTIRLDRPESQNAITGIMFDAIADALVLGDENPKIRAFVIAGTPGAFTVGSDISEFRDYVDTGVVTTTSVRFLKTLATVEKPIVAAVDGLAVGVGAVLLLHCDYVVASEWSAFSVPLTEIGLPLQGAATLLGPKVMGNHAAFEFLVMGETFDAARAREVGLVSRVVAPEVVEETAIAAAEAIARRPPEAIRLARQMLRGDRRDVIARIGVEAASFPDLQRSREARDAFEDYVKRQMMVPPFSGVA